MEYVTSLLTTMSLGSHGKRRGRKRAISLSTPQPPPLRVFSKWSSVEIPDSGWASSDFMVGSGMVIIQPSSHRIVVCYDSLRKTYFLPKGRKDIGESLEEAAVREAYEEVHLFFNNNAHILTLCQCSQGIRPSTSRCTKLPGRLPRLRILVRDIVPIRSQCTFQSVRGAPRIKIMAANTSLFGM